MTKEMLDCLKLIELLISNIKINLRNWEINTFYIKEHIELIESELKDFKEILERYS